MQEAAAGLVTDHLKLHPILRTRENGILLLRRFFQAQGKLNSQSLDMEESPLPRTTAILGDLLDGLCENAADILSQAVQQ